jgi:hypothetical protein
VPSAKYSPRGRLNVLQRHRAPDDPAIANARRDLAAASLEEHIRKTVNAAPPLTDDQKARLAALLRPCAGESHD